MTKIVDNVLELIGNTPMVRFNVVNKNTDATILGKLESFNPGSSVKDRIGLAMIEQAEKDGKLKPGGTIIEPTSGNTGIGLALASAIKGYRMILVMPSSMSIERRKLLVAYGAEIVLTDPQDGMLGAIEMASLMKENMPDAFIPQQFSNSANPTVHYKTTGPEIWEACEGKIDYFVAGVGTGGTLSGAGKYLKEKNPDIKLVAVEPVESPVMSGGEMGPHLMQGIGAGFIPGNMDMDLVDEIMTMDSHHAIKVAKDLAKKEGLLVGISAGGNAAAALEIAKRPEAKGKTIVTIMCDTGERYVSTLLFYED